MVHGGDCAASDAPVVFAVYSCVLASAHIPPAPPAAGLGTTHSVKASSCAAVVNEKYVCRLALNTPWPLGDIRSHAVTVTAAEGKLLTDCTADAQHRHVGTPNVNTIKMRSMGGRR
jgi:hypothetical protein